MRCRNFNADSELRKSHQLQSTSGLTEADVRTNVHNLDGRAGHEMDHRLRQERGEIRWFGRQYVGSSEGGFEDFRHQENTVSRRGDGDPENEHVESDSHVIQVFDMSKRGRDPDAFLLSAKRAIYKFRRFIDPATPPSILPAFTDQSPGQTSSASSTALRLAV